MFRIASIITLATAAIAVVSVSFAQADERGRDRDHRTHEVCSVITKCHHHDGRRICEKERVCKTVRDHH